VGTLLGGVLREHFKDNSAMLFAAPAVAAIVLLMLFWKTVNFPAVPAAPATTDEIAPAREGSPA
jgi:hypothetical protein